MAKGLACASEPTSPSCLSASAQRSKSFPSITGSQARNGHGEVSETALTNRAALLASRGEGHHGRLASPVPLVAQGPFCGARRIGEHTATRVMTAASAARARAIEMQPATIIAQAVFIEWVRKAGLTPRQADVLTAIERADTRAQIALAVAVSMDRTTLSKVCRRLVRKGLVRRRRLAEDTRALAVTLTPEGLTILAEIEAAATHARRAADDLVGMIEHHCMGPFAGEPTHSTVSAAR